MKRTFLLLTLLTISNVAWAQWDQALITTPEKTNYQATSTYADVMAFINTIQSKSDLVHLEYMGTSLEGKDIPVVVLANPAVSSVQEAKESGKAIVYFQGNIHSGEVEGKEVLQILMREILLGDKKYLLDNQIIVFAPIYNSDSNDKMKQGRRPSQEDSPVEVGLRPNSQGWDLNRDGIKMDAIETAALMENVILKWDPEVFVDLHTTNGTWHGYSLTWAPSYHYAGEKAPYDLTWNELLPEVTRKVKEKYGIYLGPYGGYSLRQGWPPKAIYTYNHHPRYLVNQMGLRNKIGILSEAFAHERFYQRINSTKAFVEEILEYTNKNGDKIMATNAAAEKAAIENVLENAGEVKKGVRYKMIPTDENFTLRTYNYIPYKDDEGRERYVRSGEIIDVPNVQNYSKFEATVEATLPRAYIIPKEMKHIVDHLEKQGVIVEELGRRKKYSGEVFTVTNFTQNERAFEKHNMVQIEGDFKSASKRYGKGDYYVDMAQPLTNLIFYMLEPQSDDGLVTWNFFDEYFKSNGVDSKPVEYPIFKVLK
ncbi:M14 family metallopeptidase [Balneola vulgaris]|uniref:M14 family metallopeptidase n=1 Tax=Balneola vulgaris TaxID=287535 RepID=UPI001461668B|nr:M14 family metallopeptidase [Balneola vulgaris]